MEVWCFEFGCVHLRPLVGTGLKLLGMLPLEHLILKAPRLRVDYCVLDQRSWQCFTSGMIAHMQAQDEGGRQLAQT